MTDDSVDIEAAVARAEKATPGPWDSSGWVYGNAATEGYGVWAGEPDGTNGVPIVKTTRREQGWRDAEFIAHARTDVPQMAALITELQAKLAAVEAVRRAWVASKARGGGHPYITGTLAACIGDLSDALAASPVADSSLLPKEPKQ